MIKEIWCMPHSHLDIGYTHPQPMLLELQLDYLNQAMDLIEHTREYPEEARFCWTVEGSYVLKKWLETADKSQLERMKGYVREGSICVAALPVHITPGADAREMVYLLSELGELEELLETRIKVAISHDVNGQPWTLGQLLLDSGVDFYLTGINIHFGGVPFQRPYYFQWEMADGRKLPSFLGEHYSMFSHFTHTWEHSTQVMERGIAWYVERLERQGYQKDFAFLTATNPPQYDNNSPDLELPDLVRKYNEEGHPQKIRLVTAGMLRDRLLEEKASEVPVHRGDWTDYWNFGCASTAREIRVNRLAKHSLYGAEMLECFQMKSSPRNEQVKKECLKNIMLYDEHTWGAAQSVTEPDCPETYAQRTHKSQMAYQGADLSGYLMSTQLEAYCGNPYQSNELEGILMVNPTGAGQTFQAAYPAGYRRKERQLQSMRSKRSVPYLEEKEGWETAGIITLGPYTARVASFRELDGLREKSSQYERSYDFDGERLTTPYYIVEIEKETGYIRQIQSRNSGRDLLAQEKGWGLFEPVRETVDSTYGPAVRESLFDADDEKRDQGISQWRHEWKALLTRTCDRKWKAEEQDYQIDIVTDAYLDGMKGIRQRTIFYTYSPRIRMETCFYKEAVTMPEAIYFAVPLKMGKGWKCCYDTAGEIVHLDDEQIGHVCRDYITVDTGISIYGPEGCATLSCPDAPMVQAGDFQFGKENASIERAENPLLLAWPLNNYWTTNFMADQSGRMTFAYELNVHETFDTSVMRADGITAGQPVLTGAAVTAENREQQLLHAEGETALLNIYPSRDNKSILVLMKNQKDCETVCRLESQVWNIRGAMQVTPQEAVIEELDISDGKVRIVMPSRAMKIIRLEIL